MSLFQNSVLRNHMQTLDRTEALKAYEIYKNDFLPKIDNIRISKEEQYQYGFLDDLFVKVLGYTLNPSPDYNLIAEQKNKTDSKKADGAILKDDNIIAVIELKSTKTKSMDKIVDQAFNYKHNHSTCKYVITSNFEKLRIYIEHSDAYEEFDLFGLNEARFILLYEILNKESIFKDTPLVLKAQSKVQEENISNELYKKYAALRTNLFDNIIKNNPDLDRHILLEKTQTILDRMVFIFFAEDRGILPPNTIRAIIDHYKGDIEDRELWHFYKIYFKAINEGNKKLSIPEYNGGLFTTDELLDSLIIDAEVIESLPLALSAYDFNTDIDVNILGHIFENSLNDIEELKSRIEDSNFDAKKSKRKKDGVFYTPEYITRYIVNNTLGKLCHDKKVELKLDNIDIAIPKNPKKLNKMETTQKEALETYREYLLGLKILDPACGSGAFLNQALNFLLGEHDFIDEGLRTLMGGSVLGLYDVKKGILENNLYGVDINAEAVEIAKLSLWLRTVESGRKLNKLANKIKVGNSLINDRSVVDNAFVWEEEFPEVFELGGFDVVIGNPPYVRQELIKEYSRYLEKNYLSYNGKADLYVYFFEKANNLLKTNGLLGFISSGKFFEANYGNNLKNYLIENSKIIEIINFDDREVFEGISAYPIIFLSEKMILGQYDFHYLLHNGDDFNILDHIKNKFLTVNTLDFKKYGKFISLDIALILEKLYNRAKTLENFIEMPTVGIKTGFNDGFIYHGQESKYIKNYIFGKNIKKYSYIHPETKIIFPYESVDNKYSLVNLEKLGDEKEFLISNKNKLSQRAIIKEGLVNGSKKFYEFQQINKNLNFEEEYIVYPNVSLGANFTLSKNNIVDMTAFIITSNSKYLLSILNSKLTTFLMNLWAISRRGGYREYKNQYIKKLPIIELSNEEEKPFIEKADKILEFNKNFQIKKQKFLKRLQSNFELDKLSKKLESFWQYDFKTLLTELKKKKITLTLTQQDEWEKYFETYQKELLELQVQIDATDKEIDKMVYELYGLSEEEIALVENN